MLFDIIDARSMTVREGPYTEADAKKLCLDLNWFVLRNTMPLLAALCSDPSNLKGPFYPKKRV